MLARLVVGPARKLWAAFVGNVVHCMPLRSMSGICAQPHTRVGTLGSFRADLCVKYDLTGQWRPVAVPSTPRRTVFLHATRYRVGEDVARETILVTTLASLPVALLVAVLLG